MNTAQNLFALLVKGGMMMVPLLASSILALAVVIERWWFWQRFTDRPVFKPLFYLYDLISLYTRLPS